MFFFIRHHPIESNRRNGSPPLFVVVVVVVVVSGDRVPVVFLIGFDFDDGRRGGDPSLFFFSAPSSRVEIFPICRGLIR